MTKARFLNEVHFDDYVELVYILLFLRGLDQTLAKTDFEPRFTSVRTISIEGEHSARISFSQMQDSIGPLSLVSMFCYIFPQ